MRRTARFAEDAALLKLGVGEDAGLKGYKGYDMACRRKIRDVQIGYSLYIKARYIFETGSAVILRRYHLGDRGCVSNFAHAPTRRRGHRRGRPRPGPVRRARGSAPRSGHPGEKPRKSGKCWPIVHPNILRIFITRFAFIHS